MLPIPACPPARRGPGAARRAPASARRRRRRPWLASPRRAWWPGPRARGAARRGGGRPIPSGPTVASGVANVAVSPVSPTTRVCAACASSSNCSRSRGRDRRFGPAFERDPLGGLARDLPVDRAGRLQHPHHLAEVDLREVERGGVEPPPGRRHRPRTAGAGSPERRRIGRVRRAPRGLQVETGRPRGQCMDVHSVAVTGAAGLVGQHLLPVLAAHPDVERVARPRRARARSAARASSSSTASTSPAPSSKPLLEGIDVVVHLAGVVDPIPDEALMARVNVEGTRHVLDAAAAVGARRIVRISSATVYGAWPNNPVPLTEDAPLRPNPHFSPAVQGAEVERLLAEWRAEHPDVTVTTLRSAPVVGPGRRAAARPRSSSGARRCASAARRCRCRSCTSTTSPSALALAATTRPPRRVQRRGRRLARRRRGARADRRAAPCRRCPRRRSSACSQRTWALGRRRHSRRASCRTSCTRG